MLKPALRLPLEDGSTAAGDLLFAVLFLLPASAILVLSAPLLLTGQWLWGAVALATGGFLTAAFWEAGRDVYRRRPSDFVVDFDAGTVAFIGGPADGRCVALAELRDEGTGWQPAFEGLGIGNVWIETPSGRFLVAEGMLLQVALPFLEIVRAAQGRGELEPEHWKLPPLNPPPVSWAEDDDEHDDEARRDQRRAARRRERDAKRAAVHAERAAAHAAPAAETSEPPRTVDLLRCTGCGATVIPEDADHATCRFCGAATPLPSELRERFREISARAALRKETSRLIARIVAQPSSRGATFAVLAAAAVAAIVWLGSVVMVSRAIWIGDADASMGIRAGLLVLGASAVALFVAGGYLVRRASVRAAALDFGALPPAREGDPPGCHDCGAPLAVLREALAAACAYCGATSIVGLRIPRPAHPLETAKRSLEETLGQQATTLRAWRRATVVVLPVVALIGSCTAEDVFDPSPDRRALRRCDHAAAICYWEGTSASDPAVQERYTRAACALDHAEGCMKLGAWLHVGTLGRPPDPAAARPFLERACALGHPDACVVVHAPPGDGRE
jgi:predicted RNA-binding Zn-ribbon protein involved in translation (DUF1610 family)